MIMYSFIDGKLTYQFTWFDHEQSKGISMHDLRNRRKYLINEFRETDKIIQKLSILGKTEREPVRNVGDYSSLFRENDSTTNQKQK